MTLDTRPLDKTVSKPRHRARTPHRTACAKRGHLQIQSQRTMEDLVSTPATKAQSRQSQAKARRAYAADPSDYDTREGLNARRNVLFGLWAARRLGLPAHEQDAFAWNVHFADLSEPGHDDVIEVVAKAFNERGVVISDRALRTQLREMTLRALYDLSAGGARR
ncbi:MAG: ATPase inhibitor subunit zeta [Alsobacter sp.]